MFAALPKAGGTEVGEAVLLALEHAPELALPLIRKALLADIPINRIEVAAILALIAKPWSRRELLGALEASDDQEKTADARAALLESGDEEAQKAVLAWEERNPHENEAGSYLEIGGRRLGPFYTFGEICPEEPGLADPVRDGQASRPGDEGEGCRPARAARPAAVVEGVG